MDDMIYIMPVKIREWTQILARNRETMLLSQTATLDNRLLYERHAHEQPRHPKEA